MWLLNLNLTKLYYRDTTVETIKTDMAFAQNGPWKKCHPESAWKANKNRPIQIYSPWNSCWFWIPIAELELLMQFLRTPNIRKREKIEICWIYPSCSLYIRESMFGFRFNFYPSCFLHSRRASEINMKIWLLAVCFLLISAMSLTKIKWARFQRMGTVLQANGNQSPVWGWKKNEKNNN